MKNSMLSFLCISLIVISCTKETNIPPSVDPPPPVDTTVSSIKYEGVFGNGPYGTTFGVARIIETSGRYQLRLEDFRVSSGPDLKVYISKERQPINFIRLGDLKALNGVQAYDIPGSPDFMLYRYALIHCEKFNHLFGSAELMVK